MTVKVGVSNQKVPLAYVEQLWPEIPLDSHLGAINDLTPNIFLWHTLFEHMVKEIASLLHGIVL